MFTVFIFMFVIVMVFMLNPKEYMTLNVPMIEVGMARATIRVLAMFLRKRKTTRAASIPPKRRSNCTSDMEFFINSEESKATSRFIPSGAVFWSFRIVSFTRLHTSTWLAPDLGMIPMPIELTPRYRPRERTSSTPSSAKPISLSLTGEVPE